MPTGRDEAIDYRATMATRFRSAAAIVSSRSKIKVLSAVIDIAVTLQARNVSTVFNPMTGTSKRMS